MGGAGRFFQKSPKENKNSLNMSTACSFKKTASQYRLTHSSDGLASHPGGSIEIIPVASCYRNRDKGGISSGLMGHLAWVQRTKTKRKHWGAQHGRFTLIRHENAALFLQLGLQSTLTRHEIGPLFLLVRSTVHANPSRKRSFSKTLFRLGEFDNTGFAFSCECKTL